MQSSSSQCSSKNIVVSEKIKVSSQNFKSLSSAMCAEVVGKCYVRFENLNPAIFTSKIQVIHYLVLDLVSGTLVCLWSVGLSTESK